MAFEWDPHKAEANVRKHGVQFSETLDVFSDDFAITINDDESDPDEQRFVTLGMGLKGRVWSLFTATAARTFESYPRGTRDGMNANSTRHNDEEYLRFQ